MKLDLSKIKATKPYTALVGNRDRIISIMFVLFASVISVIFSFMLPFGQDPDEMAHYHMIEEEFGTNGYIDELDAKIWQGGGYAALPFNLAGRVDQNTASAAATEHFDKRLSITDFHISPLVVRHLPMGLGFYLGVALNLPIIVCTHMAELFATAFFIVIGCLAIRITPIKKDIFALSMLIPVTVQQCSSVNYDAVLIPCCFLLFAYILHLYYREAKVGWKDIVIVGILSLVIAITKLPYATIALALLIIPVSHFDLKIGKRFEVASIIRRFWYIVVILIILAGGAAIYLGRHDPLIKTMVSDILEFPEFLKFLQRTYEQRFYVHLQQMVGMFGWADSYVTNQYVVLFYCMMVYLNTCITENVGKGLNLPRRLWMILLVAGSIFLVEVAMQSWNYSALYGWDTNVSLDQYRQYIAASDVNMGVQGRYFTPCLPMFLVALSGTTKRKKTAIYYIVQIAFYVITAYVIINTMNLRYWIV